MSLNQFYENNKAIIHISQAVIFFILIFFVFKVGDHNENLKKSHEYNVNEHFNSIVIEKGLDASNRNTPYYVLNNKSKSHIDSLLYIKIDIGDTLRKNSGQSILKIIKKDTIISFDYQTIYNYYDSIYKLD